MGGTGYPHHNDLDLHHNDPDPHHNDPDPHHNDLDPHHNDPGLGIRSFDFRVNHSFFVKKCANEPFTQKMSDSLICSVLVSEMSDLLTSLISSERLERIAHGRLFLVSKMSDSLTALI